MFVVFDTEEKLSSHLINKHKIVDTKKKFNEMFFGADDKNKKIDNKGKKNEFNFSKYIEELKERMSDYAKNVVAQRTQYNEDNAHYEQYEESYNSYNNGQGHRGSKNKNNYDNNGYRENKTIANYKDKGGVRHIMTELSDDIPLTGLSIADQTKRINYNNKPNTQIYIEPKEKSPLETAEVDYSFVFDSYYKLIKNYIKDRIIKERLKESDIALPKETQYQLIIIIDKLDNFKLSELQSLANFGIELDYYKNLKRLLAQGLHDERELYSILDKLDIRKLLIVYKYFQISWKKVDNKFYKLGKFQFNLDLEQIQENLYEDFISRDTSKQKKKEAKDEPIGIKKDNKGFKQYTNSKTTKGKNILT
jgi:hypothetical protein